MYLYKVFDIMFCDSWLHPQLKFLERDASIFVFVDFVKQCSKHMLLFIVDYSITDILTNINKYERVNNFINQSFNLILIHVKCKFKPEFLSLRLSVFMSFSLYFFLSVCLSLSLSV